MEVETKYTEIESPLSTLKIGDYLKYDGYYWDGRIGSKSIYEKGSSIITGFYRDETFVDGVKDTYYHDAVFAKLENGKIIQIGNIIDEKFVAKENI